MLSVTGMISSENWSWARGSDSNSGRYNSPVSVFKRTLQTEAIVPHNSIFDDEPYNLEHLSGAERPAPFETIPGTWETCNLDN